MVGGDGDLEESTGQVDEDGFVREGEVFVDGGGGDGAGGGSACEGGSDAAFPDLDVEAILFFGGRDEADVGTVLEVGVCGEVWGGLLEGDGGLEENDVGVAQGCGGGVQDLVAPGEGAVGGGCDGSHIDLDVCFGTGGIEVDEAALDAVVREDLDSCGGGVGVVLGCDVEGDAAQAVSAHFGARPIGVEDDHAGIGMGVWGNEQDSVGAYAAVAVAEVLDELFWERVGGGLEEEKVVAEAVILRECLGHGGVLLVGVNAQSWRLGKGGVRIA